MQGDGTKRRLEGTKTEENTKDEHYSHEVYLGCIMLVGYRELRVHLQFVLAFLVDVIPSISRF